MQRGPSFNPSHESDAATHSSRGVRWLPGGTFGVGSDLFYPEEGPVRRVSVEGFWTDLHPVTNEQFEVFVRATGYVTLAERPLDPAAFPGADPALLKPGSTVFCQPSGDVDMRDIVIVCGLRMGDGRLDGDKRPG